MALRSPANFCSTALILLFALCTRAYPAEDANDIALSQYVHEEWQTDRGLPQNSVSCIAQDQLGFLWLGTENGLVRFDGVQFESFDQPKIKDSYIAKILVAKDGTVWGALRDGGVFSFRDEHFRFITTTNSALSNDQVWTLAETTDGSIWAGTRNGLNRISHGVITRFGVRTGLPDPHVTALEPGANGDLWIGTGQGALARYHNGILAKVPASDSQQHSELKALSYDPVRNELWVGHDGGGLFLLKDGRIEPEMAIREKDIVNIQCLKAQPDGTLWVGTQYDGILRLGRGEMSTYGRRQGLSSDYIESIFFDREGSLWLGTGYGGLNRLRAGRMTTYGELEGMPEENITCVIPDGTGGLYFGSTRGGVYNYTKDKIYKKIDVGLSTHNIRGLTLARNGDLWVASGGAGLAIVNKTGVRHESTKTGLSEDETTALFEDSHSNLWVGTKRTGINLCNSNTASWKQHHSLPTLHNYIRYFAEDPQGRIWIGTQKSLVRYENGQFAEVQVPSIADPSIRCILPDDGDVLWITTRDDVILRYQAGNWTTYTFSTLRPIYHLIRTGNELWFSSNRGIERVHLPQLPQPASGLIPVLEPELFNERDGMRTSECNGGFTPAGCQTPDGRIWFGTKRGLVTFDPHDKPRTGGEAPLILTGVLSMVRKCPPPNFPTFRRDKSECNFSLRPRI